MHVSSWVHCTAHITFFDVLSSCPKGISAIVALIYTCHHTLLCLRNKGIWTFFCPPNLCKARMMGLLICNLLHISTHVCVFLSVQYCYHCSDGNCIFSCMALLFLHTDTWKFSLPLLGNSGISLLWCSTL